jgi:hypothetical protein
LSNGSKDQQHLATPSRKEVTSPEFFVESDLSLQNVATTTGEEDILNIAQAHSK